MVFPGVDEARVDAVLARAGPADGHADSLLWNRDLNRRSEAGHLDFPRLIEAGMRLQCFTVVTRGFPFVGGLALFARRQGWPEWARRGEWARALWQVERLEQLCAASSGKVALVRTRADLEAAEREGRVAAVLGLEGAHALEGDLSRLEVLWRRGVRFASLTHLSGNELGGSSFPLGRRGGVTALGRELLQAMARLGMAVDLAHGSRRLVEEVLAGPAMPVFCSHTGLRSVTPSWRNLPDDVLRAIAARQGVVCVIFATAFIGGARLEHLVRHVERALEVVGEDAVGLGSDYDGFIRLPRPMRDVRGIRDLARALLARGIPEETAAKVLGRNLRRFFAQQVLAGA